MTAPLSTAAEMPVSLQDVLDAVIDERGGRDAFSMPQLLAARAFVRLLAALSNGDVTKASGIATLEKMLPPLNSANSTRAPSLRSYLDGLAKQSKAVVDDDGAAEDAA
jgi:hypothetical protein